MARKVGQKIVPVNEECTLTAVVSDKNEEGKIYFVGVQGVPGTAFGLNSTTANLKIGRSCIYELDLTQVNGAFIKTIYVPATNAGQVIIDYIYEGTIQEG